jgi:hypothetical protein
MFYAVWKPRRPGNRFCRPWEQYSASPEKKHCIQVAEIDGNGSSIPGREIFVFFPATSGHFPRERTGIWPEKSENFPARNTASMKSSEPTVSLPYCPTWGAIIENDPHSMYE